MAELNPAALEAHNPFQGPVPGQSLTNSPDAQQPWEQAPKITNLKEGTETMFLEILKRENLEAVVTLMNEGMSIAKITEMLLFIGFTKGQFNPDMMLMLAEPTMYMLLAVAENVGIDPKINDDDDITTAEDIDEEDQADIDRLSSELGSIIRNPTQRAKLEEIQDSVEKTAIPKEIQDRVAEIDFSEIKESLLARPVQEEVQAQAPVPIPQQSDSLLQRTE